MSIESERRQQKRIEAAQQLVLQLSQPLARFFSEYRPESTLSQEEVIAQTLKGLRSLIAANCINEIYAAIAANQDKSIYLEKHQVKSTTIAQLQKAEQPFIPATVFDTKVYHPAVEGALAEVVAGLGIPLALPTRQIVEFLPGIEEISNNTFAAKATVEGLDGIRLIYRYPHRRKPTTRPTISLEIKKI